jgi:hypothetical protein
MQVTVEVQGPEPGYVATPIFLVEAAAELLDKRDSIRHCLGPGGVCAPGELLLMHSESCYVQRLQAAGVQVSVQRH